MEKKYYFLKDINSGEIDAVIIAETSTKEDIEEAVKKSKENEVYYWEDLIRCLPKDCIIIDRWKNKDNSIYY